jgi:DNA-binding transcriptional regulator YhcF (GntR family)
MKWGQLVDFRLNSTSGVATYLQLVHQVEQALRLGALEVGDQLPTVREVVGSLAINPNTVARAYRELEAAGLVEGRQGQGTFVVATLAGAGLSAHGRLRRELEGWIEGAFEVGLDRESVLALFDSTLDAVGRVEGAA